MNSERKFVSHHSLLKGMTAIILVTSFAPGAVTAIGDAVKQNSDSESSKAAFNMAYDFVLKQEGGFSNHPADLGGATMSGVTQATYNQYLRSKGLPEKPVSEITKQETRSIYQKFWRQGNCHKYQTSLAIACLDSVIQFGVKNGKSFFKDLPKDPTTAAIEVVNRRKAYRQERVNENPSQRVFLIGWLNRDKQLEDKIREKNN